MSLPFSISGSEYLYARGCVVGCENSRGIGLNMSGCGQCSMCNLVLLVALDNITYARPVANTPRNMSSALLDMVAPWDLCLVIAYARVSGNVDLWNHFPFIAFR